MTDKTANRDSAIAIYGRPRMIGIVGGVGPMSGLDLAAKIITNTQAGTDQEHLPFLLASWPEIIADRTSFLLDRDRGNPGAALASVVHSLYLAGARVMGIPCNTAHAEPIFSLVKKEAARLEGAVLINMLEQTSWEIARLGPGDGQVAILSTLGTYRCRVYEYYLNLSGVTPFDPGLEIMARVHAAIYDPAYGIKSRFPVSELAKNELMDVVRILKRQGVNVIVLGCTELPLALTDVFFEGVGLVDPTAILARALIREVNPAKLIGQGQKN
jgi:aspartate racemase